MWKYKEMLGLYIYIYVCIYLYTCLIMSMYVYVYTCVNAHGWDSEKHIYQDFTKEVRLDSPTPLVFTAERMWLPQPSNLVGKSLVQPANMLECVGMRTGKTS